MNCTHRCRSRLSFGGAKGFCPYFPKVARKLVSTFLRWLPKKDLHVILPTLGAFFSNQTTLGAIFAGILVRFSKICPDFYRVCLDFQGFSPNQNFWVCACTPASYTTDCFHFRAAVFVHVGLAQLCTTNGVSISMCSAVGVAWLADC